MTDRLTVAFRSNVSRIESATDLTLDTPRGRITLNTTPSVRRALVEGSHSEEMLCDLMRAEEGEVGVTTLRLQLGQYARLGFLRYTLITGGEPLVTIEPMTGAPPPDGASIRVPPDVRYRLSRFAFCRRDRDALVLESPRSRARVVLCGTPATSVVAELTQARTGAELSLRCPWLSESTVCTLLGLLASFQFVGVTDADGILADEETPPLESWEFHDLLFHSRSRLGRHDYESGGTYRFRDTRPPLPAVKPAMSDAIVALDRPDLDRLAREEASFHEVVERRRSVRTYGARPITLAELGEFLYRAGCVRSVIDATPSHPHAGTRRPYPSGGAIYEIELYPVVHLCDGLAAGLYHYDPLAHTLERLPGRVDRLEALLRDALGSAAMAGPPHILFVLTSRFERRAWKYAGIAYATTLKNVGVLYQTMYLVATAMGLAPCALGLGNSELFAAAAGLDPDVETSVGEFLLGSAPGEPA